MFWDGIILDFCSLASFAIQHRQRHVAFHSFSSDFFKNIPLLLKTLKMSFMYEHRHINLVQPMYRLLRVSKSCLSWCLLTVAPPTLPYVPSSLYPSVNPPLRPSGPTPLRPSVPPSYTYIPTPFRPSIPSPILQSHIFLICASPVLVFPQFYLFPWVLFPFPTSSRFAILYNPPFTYLYHNISPS